MEGWIIIIIILSILGGIVLYAENQKSKKKTELKAIDNISVGQYILGLPENGPIAEVECYVTDNEFVFAPISGREIGRIPRNSINQIFTEDKTKVTQRLTVTRMVTLNIFSLAFPKKTTHKEYCLVIDWNSPQGIRANTVFGFTGETCERDVNSALSDLLRYVQTKLTTEKADEKKCPYCAETIKKEAKVCRYCHNNL